MAKDGEKEELSTPQIFSAQNYERILNEHQKSIQENDPKMLKKLKFEDKEMSNFFYDFKNMSISSNSLYKVGKS